MISRICILCILFFGVYNLVSAQSVDLQSENSPIVEITDEGIGISSKDSTLSLNIRVRMQNRINYIVPIGQNEATSEINALVQRLRLKFSGYVLTPKLNYVLQTDFTGKEAISYDNKEYVNVLMDAAIFYDFNSNFQLGFGQAKLPGSRQKLNSSSSLQLTDRSINHREFNISYDFGIFANVKHMLPNTFSWQIKTAISSGEGRNIPAQTNNGLALSGRAEFYPLGAFTDNGAFFEGDLLREPSPKIMIGASYYYNPKTNRTQGKLSTYIDESIKLKTVFADFILKYRGMAIMASYMDRNASNPELNGIPIAINGYGFDYQASYYWPSNWEVIGRYSFLNIDQNDLPELFDERQATIGLTRYLKGHVIKLQFENGFNFYNHPTIKTYKEYYSRFQVEMGI